MYSSFKSIYYGLRRCIDNFYKKITIAFSREDVDNEKQGPREISKRCRRLMPGHHKG